MTPDDISRLRAEMAKEPPTVQCGGCFGTGTACLLPNNTPRQCDWCNGTGRRPGNPPLYSAETLLPLLDALQAAQRELALWRPLTPEEAQKAYDEAEAVPLSEEEVARIMEKVLDPAERITNSEEAQLAARCRKLERERDALRQRAEAAEQEVVNVKLDLFAKVAIAEQERDILIAEKGKLLGTAIGEVVEETKEVIQKGFEEWKSRTEAAEAELKRIKEHIAFSCEMREGK